MVCKSTKREQWMARGRWEIGASVGTGAEQRCCREGQREAAINFWMCACKDSDSGDRGIMEKGYKIIDNRHTEDCNRCKD